MISSTDIKLKIQELLKPFAELAGSIGVSPNVITILGFLFSIFSGIAIALSNLTLGVIFFTISGLCDMLDGIVARVNGKTTNFGSFLDSFLDRYADFFPLAGIATLGFYLQDFNLFIFSLLSIVGSFATSYARAKAESLGLECKVGLLERPERFFILLAGFLTGFLVEFLSILAILSNFTAFQRLICAMEKLRK
ncbi:CDP-alcohol phosphatidyltransferase family protein [Desulfurobacterium thermolithotrophum]|uniref:CDP-alcohol phosphatidyltransferase family protein n=1 Tax=Desulfurobacterium thermolithotrophum TaxID=64160 RepID=UPI0013D70669|nr:CDP-alcohol phosphatidyltransferase family protein [Desulfurobacterium thermolithotrophum]